jgi:hypothetical protein
VSRRKDRERFLQRKAQDPGYAGFRGAAAPQAAPAAVEMASAVCSVCRRKRNVPAASLPADRGSFVCATCRERQAPPAG